MIKKLLLFVLLVGNFCACIGQVTGESKKSSMVYDAHNKKLYNSEFTAEQRKLHSVHLKELKKSGRFATVSPFYPVDKSEFYYLITYEKGKDAKKGLLYTCFDENGVVFDTIVAPVQYDGFVVKPRTTGYEPVYAWNGSHTYKRAIYYNHKHSETAIFAFQNSGSESYFDTYTVKCPPYSKMPIELKKTFTHINNATAVYVPGFLAIGLQGYFLANDESYTYYYFRNLDLQAPPIELYRIDGTPIYQKKDNVHLFWFFSQNKYTKNCRLAATDYAGKSGVATLAVDSPIITPVIFADCGFDSYDNRIYVKCKGTDKAEYYSEDKISEYYERIFNQKISPIEALLNQNKWEEALLALEKIPAEEITTQDCFYAALACGRKVFNELSLLNGVNSLLKRDYDLSSVTIDLPNLKKARVFTNSGRSMALIAKKDTSLITQAIEIIENLDRFEKEINQAEKDYAKLYAAQQARVAEQQRKAQFWASFLGAFIEGLGNAAVSALDRSLSSSTASSSSSRSSYQSSASSSYSSSSGSSSSSSSSSTSSSSSSNGSSYEPIGSVSALKICTGYGVSSAKNESLELYKQTLSGKIFAKIGGQYHIIHDNSLNDFLEHNVSSYRKAVSYSSCTYFLICRGRLNNLSYLSFFGGGVEERIRLY